MGKLFNDDVEEYNAIIQNGKITHTAFFNEYKYKCQFAFETEFKGYKCIAINHPKGGSKLFDPINGTDYDIQIVFYTTGNDKFNISLYISNPAIDVSSIATEYGGGGHANAAGFKVPINELPFKIRKD